LLISCFKNTGRIFILFDKEDENVLLDLFNWAYMIKKAQLFRNTKGQLISKSKKPLLQTICWILFAVIVLFNLLFKTVVVKNHTSGIVYSIWNDNTIYYLKPGKHLIFRFFGYSPIRPMPVK